MPTRRSILLASAGVLSTAALGIGVVGGTVYSAWWDQPHAQNLQFLSQEEADFADALADAIFPPSAGLPLRGREAGVAVVLDEVFSGMTSFQRKMLRLSLHALDQYPLLTHGTAFRNLSAEQGGEVVAGWASSELAELRGIVASVYIFVTMAFSVHPKISPVFAAHFPCGYGR